MSGRNVVYPRGEDTPLLRYPLHTHIRLLCHRDASYALIRISVRKKHIIQLYILLFTYNAVIIHLQHLSHLKTISIRSIITAEKNCH